jgi:effector-binding domain-containing protein
MTGSEDITVRQVGDMLIASIRFRGEYDEVPQRFGQLYEQVQPYVAGKAILLHHYFDESVGAGHDLEVCYPVSQPVETEEVKSWMLEGGQMLCALHVGPLGTRGEPGSISDVWQKIWDYARQHEIIPDSVPRREVYLEDAQEHGDNTAQYVIEAQLAYAFYRMEKLAENLECFAGEAVRREVMADSERFPLCSAHEKATWLKGAMERLDSIVGDEDTRRDIMITVGDQFPRTRIQMLRDVYQRTGDLDELLEIMRADRTLGDLSWYEVPVREGNFIHVTKDPYSPEEYQKATDENEKRAAYCHCGRLREAIRTGMTMSRTYCYCGAGWYKQLWEGILGQPVRVEVVKSVLQGDDRCSFTIQLPTMLVEGLIDGRQ